MLVKIWHQYHQEKINMNNRQQWAVRMADSIKRRNPIIATKWAYEWGVVLKGILGVWSQTGSQDYFDYVKANVDRFVQPGGQVLTYSIDEYNLDQINAGKLLFPLYAATGDDGYKQAADLLREQLRTHPRTSEGGFWHKLIYPHQMWLDGIYMASPFLAEYAAALNVSQDFDDAAHQITLIEQHTRDTKTGLLYHGWDESREQKWSDPITGCSPHFWGRAMGWYLMAIPDVLDHLPPNYPQRESIIAIFKQAIAAITAVQDQPTGLWYQILDQGDRQGNYLEASASCMLVYAIAKGIRQGLLDNGYKPVVDKAYSGILENFVEVDREGLVNLNRICSVAGLGGTPYRDGSFDYYVGEKIVTNDFKGLGAFILAAVEMNRLDSN
jgi:unsaturated rhamnogalacturonyl hydrolase